MNHLTHTYPSKTYLLHKSQEEKLLSYEEKYPNEENLKIKLTYERALLAIYEFSCTPEYEKYFYSLRGLTPITTSPKVLGAWIDKIGNLIRIALLDEKKETDEFIGGKILGLNLNADSFSWHILLNLSTYTVKEHAIETNENKNFNYRFHFLSENEESFLTMNIPKEKSSPQLSEISPIDTTFTYLEHNYIAHAGPYFYNEIQEDDLEREYDVAKVGNNIGDRENRHRYFMIPYREIEAIVNARPKMKNANKV